MPHGPPHLGPEDVIAQQDATAIPQPGVVPQPKGPSRWLGAGARALFALLGHEIPGIPEGTLSGPGPLETLSPEGPMFGSLPLFGRAAPAGEVVHDVGRSIPALRRLLGDVPADVMNRILNRSRSTEAIEMGAARADAMEGFADIIRQDIDALGYARGTPEREAADLALSRTQGGREMVQSDLGRSVLAADQYQTHPDEFRDFLNRMEDVDSDIVDTFLQDFLGFPGEVER